MPDEETYLIKLTLVRHELMEHASPAEAPVFRKHYERLRWERDRGRVLLAGPCLDGAFGIIVFRAPSEDKARRFMEEDPTAAAGLMHAQLHPFRVSLAAWQDT